MDLEKKLLVTKKSKLHEMEKEKKKTHKIVIHLYTPVQIIGQKQKYRKRNAGSIPLRP